MSITVLIIVGVVIVNAVTFVQFGADKQRAMRGVRRIRESHLLQLAFFGGTPAAYLARRVYRHKTRKQPFSDQLAAIAMLQVGVTIGLTIAFF
ncbi:DUF1294 domain-containing protein [Roseomonas aeriglobus]|nr:DUF1294 domain-containing protein [Roseomonas aeriglobus]